MKKFYVICLSIVFLYSCAVQDEKIHGNGDVQQKEVTVEGFYQIEINGAFEITLIQDTLWKVELEAESNILPLIDVYKTGSKLVIENKDDYSFDLNNPIKILIHHSGADNITFSGAGVLDLGEFSSLTLTTVFSGAGSISGTIESSQIDFIISGSGNIDADVTCYELDASISGQGDFTFRGSTTRSIFSISGVGNINALNMVSKSAWCNISGVGNAYLKVSDELHATISGAGTIFYDGSPELDKHLSGSGKVIKL